MKRGPAGLAWALALTGACGGALSRPPTSGETPGDPPLAFSLSGTVRDEFGQPLADADVVAFPFGGHRASTRTDGQGTYVVDIRAAPLPGSPLGTVQVSRLGYEGHFGLIPPPDGSRALVDARLYRLASIVVGETARVVVSPGDSYRRAYGEWFARRVWVQADRAGVVTIEAVPDGGSTAALDVVDEWGQSYCCDARNAVRVAEGEGLHAYVLLPASATQSETYTVRTSFAP